MSAGIHYLFLLVAEELLERENKIDPVPGATGRVPVQQMTITHAESEGNSVAYFGIEEQLSSC